MLREGVLSNARQDMEQICCERECYRAPCQLWSIYAARGSAIEHQEQICCERKCDRTPGKIWSRYAAGGSAMGYGADMLREGVLSNARQDMEQIC